MDFECIMGMPGPGELAGESGGFPLGRVTGFQSKAGKGSGSCETLPRTIRRVTNARRVFAPTGFR